MEKYVAVYSRAFKGWCVFQRIGATSQLDFMYKCGPEYRAKALAADLNSGRARQAITKSKPGS